MIDPAAESSKLDNKKLDKRGDVKNDSSAGILNNSKEFAKVRIYVPLMDSYTYFYLLRIDEDVTGEAVLAQVLS